MSPRVSERSVQSGAAPPFSACDLCGSGDPQFVLESPLLDGPLVRCTSCGLYFVGNRRSGLTFGAHSADETIARVREANLGFDNLQLAEEQRLAHLNACWRFDLIKKIQPYGKLLEVGCARGDFLRVALDCFDVYGVEPNVELAQSAEGLAPIHRGVIENLPWNGFDVVATFHVIEHVNSPSTFIKAIAERMKPGGLLVIETPNIQSLPFRLFRKNWRQFIPEHYYFFDPGTLEKLLDRHGFKVQKTIRIGKYASMNLILNRLSRYIKPLKRMETGSRAAFRVNPLDIMLVFATKSGSE